MWWWLLFVFLFVIAAVAELLLFVTMFDDANIDDIEGKKKNEVVGNG